MQSFFEWFDRLADIKSEKSVIRWLERTAFFFLILMLLSAPHSIAATQIAWLTGMFAWVVRLCFKPRPKLVRTPLDLILWGLFGWTVLSTVFSYAPDISVDKLRNASLFLIFYFILNLVRTKRTAVILAGALIFSCMFNVLWMPFQRIIGRGVEISGVKKDGPLTKSLMFDGDTLLEVNKNQINEPEDLLAAIEQNETVHVKAYRPDYNFEVEVKRADLLKGENALEKLGFDNWKPSRNWRSAGFYAHYTTYAEVLQLIASLTFGLFVSSISYKFSGFGSQDSVQPNKSRIFTFGILFPAICVVGMVGALLLTGTRASQAAFGLSAFIIVLTNGSRKLLLSMAVIFLPIALTGAFLIQKNRKVDFIDSKDGSTQYRLMMYHDGFKLWTTNARNFTLGVGMDSTKRYWSEWGLFDKGWQPMGHFHSTLLQLAVERGLPALILWLGIIWIYGRTFLRFLKPQGSISNYQSAAERGIILGALGGLIGFFVSGLVHYNYGDAIIAMMFFIVMGLGLIVVVQSSSEAVSEITIKEN